MSIVKFSADKTTFTLMECRPKRRSIISWSC